MSKDFITSVVSAQFCLRDDLKTNGGYKGPLLLGDRRPLTQGETDAANIVDKSIVNVDIKHVVNTFARRLALVPTLKFSTDKRVDTDARAVDHRIARLLAKATSPDLSGIEELDKELTGQRPDKSDSDLNLSLFFRYLADNGSNVLNLFHEAFMSLAGQTS